MRDNISKKNVETAGKNEASPRPAYPLVPIQVTSLANEVSGVLQSEPTALKGTCTTISYLIDPVSLDLKIAVCGISRSGGVICCYEAIVPSASDRNCGISAWLSQNCDEQDPLYIDGFVLQTLRDLTSQAEIGWKLTVDHSARQSMTSQVLPHGLVPPLFDDFVEDPSVVQTWYATHVMHDRVYSLYARVHHELSIVSFFMQCKEDSKEWELIESLSCSVSTKYPLGAAYDLVALFVHEGPDAFRGKVSWEMEQEQRAAKQLEQTLKDGELNHQLPYTDVTIATELQLFHQIVGNTAIIQLQRKDGAYDWSYSWVVSASNLATSSRYQQFSRVFEEIQDLDEPRRFNKVKVLLGRLRGTKIEVVCRDDRPLDLSDIVGFDHAYNLENCWQDRIQIEHYTPIVTHENDPRWEKVLFGERGYVIRLTEPGIEHLRPDVFNVIELHSNAFGYGRVLAHNSLGGHMRVLAKQEIIDSWLGEIIEAFASQDDRSFDALRTKFMQLAQEETEYQGADRDGQVSKVARFVSNVPPSTESLSYNGYKRAAELACVYGEIAGDNKLDCEVVWDSQNRKSTLFLGRHLGVYRFALDVLGDQVIKMRVLSKVPHRPPEYVFWCELAVSAAWSRTSVLNATLCQFDSFMRQSQRNLPGSDFLEFLRGHFGRENS